MLRNRIAATLAVGLMAGVTLVAGAGSASAHTGTLATKAVCNDDGTRTVTFSGVTTNVPAEGKGHTATLTVGELKPADAKAEPSTQKVVGDTKYSFAVTVPGTVKSVHATAFLTWGDGAKSDPHATATFTSDCKPPVEIIQFPKPEVKDACGPDNAEWIVPADSADVHWTLTADGRLIGEIVKKNATWPNGTTVNSWGTAPDSGEACPVPVKPEPIVKTVNTSATDCKTRTVTTTHTTTTTDYVLVDNVWVLGTPVVTTNETTAPATEEQCPTPVKPAPVVKVIDKRDTNCKNKTVTIHHTTYTMDWVLKDNVWVKGETVVTTSDEVIPATAEQCPAVVTPPVTGTPLPPVRTPVKPVIAVPVVKAVATPVLVKAPVAVQAAPELAYTGSDFPLVPLMIISAIGIFGGMGVRRWATRKD